MTTIITDNVGNASDAKVLADTENLLDLRPLGVGTQEVADRREPLGTAAKRKGYELIQEPGPVKGHVALLVRSDANPRNIRLHQIGKRTHVGRDVAGARHDGWTAAKYILAADVTDPDTGRDLTIATMHLVPSASHSKAASRLLATQAANAAKWLAEQPLPTDLMGDCNGQANRKEFAPLRKVAAPMSAPSREGAAIDIHWVTQGRGIAHALDGFSSDHKPVVAEITWAKPAPEPKPQQKEKPVSKPLWLPDVIRKPIPAGSNDPKIIPVGDVFHVAVSMADSLHDFFEHDGGIESTGYIRLDGTLEQYRPLDVECDAQGDGNSWLQGGRRLGFNSWETEGMGEGTWTDAQLATIKRIIAFKHEHYGTPLRRCPGPFSPGFGYHCLFTQWNHNNHSCPGPDRVKQFNAVIVPWMSHGAVPEEDDMQLTDKINSDTTVREVLRQVHNSVPRTDDRLKQILALLDPDAFAAKVAPAVAAAIGDKAGLSKADAQDAAEKAVRKVLAEGVDQ